MGETFLVAQSYLVPRNVGSVVRRSWFIGPTTAFRSSRTTARISPSPVRIVIMVPGISTSSPSASTTVIVITPRGWPSTTVSARGPSRHIQAVGYQLWLISSNRETAEAFFVAHQCLTLYYPIQGPLVHSVNWTMQQRRNLLPCFFVMSPRYFCCYLGINLKIGIVFHSCPVWRIEVISLTSETEKKPAGQDRQDKLNWWITKIEYGVWIHTNPMEHWAI